MPTGDQPTSIYGMPWDGGNPANLTDLLKGDAPPKPPGSNDLVIPAAPIGLRAVTGPGASMIGARHE